ncbi:DUF7350 domain-containing protein [Natronorarus salvus]|uniref:DUF7350 domain-containing protein n=1 Tax=Natronorarus salvus TaxID=3117733 RepID=UPI002F2673BA
MNRRQLLSRAGTLGAVAFAGCSDPTEEETPTPEEDDVIPEFPEIEEPPDRVYLPTHREGMEAYETLVGEEVAVTPMLTYPHPFWIVDGTNVERVEPTEDDEVHLMATVWDVESGLVLPMDAGLHVEIEREGDLIDERVPWPMLSQEMGFHFGDNVPLDGDGRYEVRVTTSRINIEKTRGFEERFEEGERFSFEFEFDDAFRQRVVDRIEWLDEDRWGEPGALSPMTDNDGHDRGDDHGSGNDDQGDRDDNDRSDVPYARAPRVEEVPGTHLLDPETGEPSTSGDGVIVVSLVGRPDAEAFFGLDVGDDLPTTDEDEGEPLGEEAYLIVSPRSPYNRVPLTEMALSVEHSREGDDLAEERLSQTIDSELGFHYGLALSDVAAGDDLSIEIDTPPQTARHQGYETAFVEMSPVDLVVPDEWGDGEEAEDGDDAEPDADEEGEEVGETEDDADETDDGDDEDEGSEE